MSITFPSSNSANTVPTGKPVDLQTLQKTFAAVLRSYSSNKETSQTDTMLEVLQTAQEENADAQKQERQEYHQRVDPNDVAQIDRKIQNKSEMRQGEMNSDYQDRRDRHAVLQQDYQEKVEQRVPGIDSGRSTADSSGVGDIIAEVPSQFGRALGWGQSANQSVPHPIPASKGEGVLPAVVSNQPAMDSNQSAAVLPQSNTARLIPTVPVPTPPAAPINVFTIFTASKRFEQNQEKQDDNGDDEKEESAEAVPIRKTQPFALFEAIQNTMKTSDIKRQATTAAPRQTTERETTIVPPNVKSLNELTNTLPNEIVPQKNESNQSSEQMQLFHRIAAACEAAAQYAPIRIKVHLGHIGTMTLRFFYQADKLTLHFETPTEDTADFLQEHIEGLKTILSKRKVRLESIEVFLTDQTTIL